MPRPPRPDDLYRLRIATEPRLSPDGRWVVVTLQTVAPTFDGYRTALWLVATDEDGPPPRQLTLGTRHDRHPRFSPDGSTLAFLSDRRTIVEEEPSRGEAKDREDATQVHLLPLDGGEARRLTDLPRGVTGFEWSPDGTRLVVTSPSHAATWEADRRRRGLTAARAGDAAAVRLPVHRPAPLDAQRRRLHLRPDRPPVARRRRDRGREPPDRRAGRRHPAGVVAGRPADRVHLGPRPRPGPGAALAHPRRRRGDEGRDRDQRGAAVDVRVLDVDAGRAIAARHGRPPAGERRVRQRPVGLRGGRVGRHARRRPQRLAPPRPDAALGDDQRRHDRRAGASGGRCRRDPCRA